MVKEPDMTNGKQLGDHVKKLVDKYNEREGIERIGVAIRANEKQVGAKVREINQPVMRDRANEKQVGGNHYKNMGVEPWDVVDTWPLYQRIGYYRGGALKYIMRLGNKDEMEQEAGKGLHYLEKLLEVLKEQRDAD
jgi:hypothetical protein